MADSTNSIDIVVTDKVAPDIAPRLIRIAEASDKASKSLGSLKTQLASMNTAGIGGLSAALASVQSGSVAASTAQSGLSGAMRQTAGDTTAVNGALRVMTGSMFGATRSAASFLTEVLGLGSAFTALYSVIGAVALVDILYQVGVGFYKMVKEAEDAGHNIAKAFDEAIDSLRKTDDELAITNDKLDVTIAKLQGKPSTNGIQLALDEARSSADKLDDSLEKVQNDLEQVLQKYSVNFFGSLFTGQSDTNPTADFVRKQFDQLSDVRQKATESIDRATSLRDPKASHAALLQAYTQERAAIQSVVSALQTEYNAKQRLQNAPALDVQTPYGDTQAAKFDQTANLTMLGKAAHLAQEEMRGLDLTMSNIGKNEVVDKLRDHTSELKDQIKQAAAQ
ncbi:MAG TPA: hypothetical protein VHX20_02695 [Terracidiphilus sp.]|jgi:hypothetical protein|nr:hypothetical protein [Terracidiphilus sp.]